MAVFVTVGTTKFEKLIETIDEEWFLDAIESNGCTEITIQLGSGVYEPQNLVRAANRRGITCNVFDFTHDFATVVSKASLVIGHAGRLSQYK